MNNRTTRIYALAVCFASLMCGAIATGFFLFNMIKVIAPEATIEPNTIRYYSSNEAFRNSRFSSARARPVPFAIASGVVMAPPVPITNDPTDTPELGEEEIENLRLQQLNAVLSNHTFRARQGIILQTIIMLISLVLFIVQCYSTKSVALRRFAYIGDTLGDTRNAANFGASLQLEA